MRVIICDTAESAIRATAWHLIGQVKVKPKSVLGLATGGTMEKVYALIVDAHRQGVSFADVTSFNLDEYVGLAPEHPQSYRTYMQEHLFDYIDICGANTNIPNGLKQPKRAARDYEDLIQAHGPMDIQLLGLGHNGHIAFNEPGSSLGSRTREKTLSKETIEANSRFFSVEEQQPLSAITMGIATILEANSLALLAFGKDKAQAVKNMVEGPVSAYCPASAIQFHPSAHIYIDQLAASHLTLKEHYHQAEEIQSGRELSPTQ